MNVPWSCEQQKAHPCQSIARSTRHVPSTLVWSKAPVVIAAQDTGPLIRSKDGFWASLSADGAKPAGGRSPPEQPGSRGRLKVQDRARARNRADLLVGPAGQAAKTAGSGAGCRSSARSPAGCDRDELGAGHHEPMVDCGGSLLPELCEADTMLQAAL